MAYHEGQPFNKNHLRPCPMLENPELLQEMVHRTGAHSTDLESPEPVEHLCGKCSEYASNWQPSAYASCDSRFHPHLAANWKHKKKQYENYKKATEDKAVGA